MTEDIAAPPPAPETPALIQHVENLAEAAAKIEADAAPVPTAAERLDAEIEAWFVERIHNSPVSRATEIYNHVRDAVDALKKRLAAL